MKTKKLILFILISFTIKAQQLSDSYEITRSVGFQQNDFFDINSDGILDMVTLGVDDFSYYIGNGDGTFGMKQVIRDSLSIGMVQVINFDNSDFNEDGKIDFVLAANISDGVEVFINNGSGFNLIALENVDPFIKSVFCLDMTGDGLEDILTGHLDITAGNQQWIQIFVNQGGGNFSGGSTLANNITVDDIFKLQDMDNDGDEDIVKRHLGLTTSITIIKNNGTSFSSGLYYTVTAKTFSDFDFLDIDNDGFQDIVIPFHNTLNSIHCWKNLGDANTLEGLNITVPTRANSNDIKTIDINQDNKVDVIMTTENLVYWYENTLGTFQLMDTLANGLYYSFKNTLIADLNNDLLLDLSVLDGYGSSVYLNDGTTQFPVSDRITQAPTDPMFVDIKDIDNDGVKDVIYSTGYGSSYIKDIVWQKSNGNNFYNEETVILRNFIDIMGYEVEDVDNDGDNDLVIGCSSCNINGESFTNRLLIMWNDGAGNFSVPDNLGATNARYIKVVDIDNDLDKDIVVVSNSVSGYFSVKIFWNIGTGFSEQTIYYGTNNKQDVFVADMNGDQKNDLVIKSTIGISTPGFEIWFNNGLDNFPSRTTYASRNFQIDVRDYDNDGDNDVMKSYTYGSNYEGIMLLKNNGAGIFTDSINLEYFAPSVLNSKFLYPFDFDDDMDLDLFTLESDSISYFENLGNGNFATSVIIQTGNWLLTDLALANIDGDPNKEIVIASEGHDQVIASSFVNTANTPVLAISNDTVCAGSTIQINVINNTELNENTSWALYEGTMQNAPIQVSTTGNFAISVDTTTNFYVCGYGGLSINGSVEVATVSVYQSVWEETVSACGSYTWTANSTTYFASGDYLENFISSQGCDSIVILHLTVNTNALGNETAVSCNNFYWPTSGLTYSESGIYSTTLSTSNGCDSLVTLELTINQQSFSDTSVVACQSYDWFGNNYSSSGNYTNILPNTFGCDSIITLHLTINQTSSATQTITACGSYIWSLDGNNYTQSGQYTSILSNAEGCDSLVTLDLTINQQSFSDTSVVACQSFDWFGNTYSSSGNYTNILPNAFGCDSTITLHLTIHQTSSSTQTITACDNYTWSLDGNNYTQSGQYTAIVGNAEGCDSVVTLNLIISSSTTGIDVVSACDSYTWLDGITYSASTSLPTWNLSNSLGCDSIVNLNLTINSNTTSTIIDTAIGFYLLNGIEYTSSGVYTQIITNANGCDSIINLELTINNVGIDELTNENILIYPNPSYGNLIIQWDVELITVLELKLFDNKGRLVEDLDTGTHHHVVKTSVDGVYFIKVVTKQGIFYKKWVRL